jgi:hypothetical protein
MRWLKFRFISLVFFIGCAGLNAEENLYPTDKPVELTGTVERGAGSDANDRHEEYYFLRLDKAISVQADEIGDERRNVKDLQLVPLSGVVLGPFLGKRIAIKGKLSHAISAHHHMKVLLEVDRSNAARQISQP